MARSLRQSSQDAPSTLPPKSSNAARLPRWRKCLTVLALLCAVGLYSDAITHHHTTLAQEIGCPVCHAVGHNPLSIFSTSLAPAPQTFGWLRSRLPSVDSAGFRQFLDPAHRSRAPPSSVPRFA